MLDSLHTIIIVITSLVVVVVCCCCRSLDRIDGLHGALLAFFARFLRRFIYSCSRGQMTKAGLMLTHHIFAVLSSLEVSHAETNTHT